MQKVKKSAVTPAKAQQVKQASTAKLATSQPPKKQQANKGKA